jgi:hypothetical protein
MEISGRRTDVLGDVLENDAKRNADMISRTRF